MGGEKRSIRAMASPSTAATSLLAAFIILGGTEGRDGDTADWVGDERKDGERGKYRERNIPPSLMIIGATGEKTKRKRIIFFSGFAGLGVRSFILPSPPPSLAPPMQIRNQKGGRDARYRRRRNRPSPLFPRVSIQGSSAEPSHHFFREAPSPLPTSGGGKTASELCSTKCQEAFSDGERGLQHPPPPPLSANLLKASSPLLFPAVLSR